MSQVDNWWKIILGKESTKCKFPDVEVSLECLKKSNEASVAGKLWVRGRVIKDEIREEVRDKII